VNIAIQPLIPARIIRFGTTAPSGTVSTATVALQPFDNAAQVARRVSEEINTRWTQTITIVSLPTNGDIVEISNNQTDFNLIFWDTAFAQPSNPSTIRKAIYVQFTGADTTTQIAASTASALNFGVAGIPRAADLGYTFLEGIEFYMCL